MTPTPVTRLDGFDDPRTAAAWRAASAARPTPVFMTLGWQRAWWRAYGRGELVLLATASRDGAPVIAPLFVDGDMLFLVGSGNSDRLDLVGAVDETSLAAVLAEAWRLARGPLGLRLYHVPAESATLRALGPAARRLGLEVVDEGSLRLPALDLRADGRRAADKTSLRRHERALGRLGRVAFLDIRDGPAVRPWLEMFAFQHAARWAAVGVASAFDADPRERAFVRHAADEGGAEGWLRFCVLLCDERPVAFHYGMRWEAEYAWYKPSFDVTLARWSPGEVLLRRTLLAAMDEGAEWFDLGIGEEAYKDRFTSVVRGVTTVGVYPGST